MTSGEPEEQWAFGTASWPNRTEPGWSRGQDSWCATSTATSAPLRGPWADEEWQGWWGDQPPFHNPVFVMTHHERPSFSLSDTTFHCVDGSPPPPALELALALEAADCKDVRLGGGTGQIARSWRVGTSIYVGVTYGDLEGAMTLEDAEPVVERNSTRAEIDHFICIPAWPGDGIRLRALLG